MTRRETMALLLLIMGACCYRIATIPRAKTVNPLGIYGDERYYFRYAYQMLVGNGFSISFNEGNVEKVLPVITRAPGYSFFVSQIFGLFGMPDNPLEAATWVHLLERVRYIQCLLDSLCCLLIFYMARKLEREKSYMPFLAALFYACSPYNAHYSGRILSETLTTSILACTFLLAMKALESGKHRWYFAVGMLLGFLSLVRPQYQLCGPMAFCSLLILQRKTIVTALTRASLLLLATALIIAPWTFRNYIRFRHFVPVSVGSLGQALFMGTVQVNEKSWRGWSKVPDDGTLEEDVKKEADYLMALQIPLQQEPIDTVIEKEREFVSLALSRMKRKPLTVLLAWFHKLPRLWYLQQAHIYGHREASGFLFLFWVILAMVGLFMAPADIRILLSPICLMIVYIFVIFLPLWIEPRYGVPLVPGYIVLASYGIKVVIDSLQSKIRASGA